MSLKIGQEELSAKKVKEYLTLLDKTVKCYKEKYVL